jgi:hypothetical protein
MSIEDKTYEAIYYPDCYPKSLSAFASSALYFDRLNFVTPSSMTSDYEEHTEFLKNITQKDFQVYAMLGDNARERGKYGTTERSISRILEYYEFVSKIRSLLGSVVFYHPNLLTKAMNRVQTGLTSGGGVSIGELYDLMNGKTDEQRAIKEFVNSNPELDDGILELVLPTARHLAIQNNWITISDVSSLPTPVVENARQSADYLASVIALELISVSVPLVEFTNPDDILEARDKLAGELTEFRVLMLRMAGDLRRLLSSEANHETVRREARFLVNTKLEPILFEVKKRISQEKKKLWWRLFGKVAKNIPLVVGSFLDPTSVCLSKAIQVGVKDASELLNQANGITAMSSTGISYLMKLEGIFTE